MLKNGIRAPLIAWLAALAGVYILILSLNLPGHLSVDSVISLAEGRTGQRITWGPPLYSWFLGFFDRFRPGTALYVAASALLLVVAWAAMARLRPVTWWTAPLLLVGVAALPQIAIYQGIVWKDILFANLAVAAFVTLAFALKRWDRTGRRIGLLVLAAVLLAVASLVRQNGFVTIFAAAVAVAWVAAAGRRWIAGLAWGAALAVTAFVLTMAIDAIVPVKEKPGADLDRGIRVVQQYDIIGAVGTDPDYPLPIMEARAPEALALVRKNAPRVYTPARSDPLDNAPEMGLALWGLDSDIINDQWRQILVTDPLGYAKRRLDVFRWVFATPDIDVCLPVHVGVGGRPQDLSILGMAPRRDRDDMRLYNYVTWHLDTPSMSHLTYAAAALGVGLFLLWRRQPADIAVAAMLGAALVFAATFFILSLACDYRYLYFLDLAAITGVLYVALDPRRRRGQA